MAIITIYKDLEAKHPGIIEYTLSGFPGDVKNVTSEEDERDNHVAYEVNHPGKYVDISLIDTFQGEDILKDDPTYEAFPTMFKNRYQGYKEKV